MTHAYIGTSGWIYPGWREHLYAGIPVKRWLEVVSRTFNALEINGSHYKQISAETYARWRDATPAKFRFALKGHRFITHYKRLKDCEEPIVRLRDQARGLGDKLAAVVWQLPRTFARDVSRLDGFLRALTVWPVRHALEMRHRSWFRGLIAAVPEIDWLKVPAQELDFLDFEEANRLLAAVDEGWRTMVLTALRTGMRMGELIALRWQDVDLSPARSPFARTR